MHHPQGAEFGGDVRNIESRWVREQLLGQALEQDQLFSVLHFLKKAC
jgi:hypothetical protein